MTLVWIILAVILAVLALVLVRELSRVRQEIKKLKKELQELSRKRTDFVANLSHELKTPLTSIQGFAETLMNGAIHEPERAAQFLQKILYHTNRLDRLIHDILELSRLEATDQHLSIEEISLDDFFNEIREAFQIQLDQKRQSLVVENQVAMLKADRHLLEQALSNLISNANRYCQEGALFEIKVVKVEKEGRSWVQMDILDNGPGILAEELPRIFERFYTADKSRNRAFGGTGLGLAIVKHIILSHGGYLSAENLPTGGMRFRITLPLR